MKTKLLLLSAATLCCLTSTVFTSCANSDDDSLVTTPSTTTAEPEKSYIVKILPVIRDGQSAGTASVRFYEDMPSVPYISVADFQGLMLPGTTVSVTKTGDNTYQLANPGSTATVNTADETFTVNDYMAYTNLMGLKQQGMDNAYLDGAPYVRYSYQTLTEGSAKVTFNYSKYDIDLRGDDQTVYFPFSTLADLYADLHYHNAACNGEKVVVASVDDDTEGIASIDKDFTIEEILAKGKRSADLAAYSYHELCFVIDHFYGMPGRSAYEESIRENGFDKTLEASEDGKTIKNLLLSTDLEEYGLGLELTQLYLDDGGHTHMWDDSKSLINYDGSIAFTLCPDLAKRWFYDYFMPERYEKSVRYFLLKDNRTSIYGDELKYHKKGNTAICHFDGFTPIDKNAWSNYYNGTAPMPTQATTDDAFVVFLDALKKANDDPEVKNLVIDLTLNTGGSLDIVVAMTSLMYGQSFGRCINTFTGQHTLWYYDVDRNFDGKFDEKDKEVRYDLKFCVLTSDFAFSCGNLFPALCKEAGVLIAGQKSGGGSCAICMYRTPEGFRYQISSARGRLADSQWQNIDGGVVPHVAIPTGPDLSVEVSGRTIVQPGLNDFYDLDNLRQIMSDYYGN